MPRPKRLTEDQLHAHGAIMHNQHLLDAALRSRDLVTAAYLVLQFRDVLSAEFLSVLPDRVYQAAKHKMELHDER